MNETMKTILACLSLCLTLPVIGNADEPAADLKTVKARTIELKVPKAWEEKEATSMRAAQFTIPGKPNDAELVVFYFGGPTGGVKANVERWIGQFQKEGLKLNMYQGKCRRRQLHPGRHPRNLE